MFVVYKNYSKIGRIKGWTADGIIQSKYGIGGFLLGNCLK